jgi:DNA polymerase-1
VGQKLRDGKEMAYMSRQLAQLYFDAPIDLDLAAMDIRELDTAKLHAMLKKLQFASLLRNLPDHMQHHEVATMQVPVSTAKKVDWDDEYRTKALMADKVIVQLLGDMLVVSADSATWSVVDVAQSGEYIPHISTVTHDGNALCRYLLNHGQLLPVNLYDIRQAGFLLNPLVSSRTIAAVTKYEGDDTAVIVAELWRVYSEQIQQLSDVPTVRKVADQIDFPMIPILARMEHRGIILDTTKLAHMNKDLSREIARVQDAMYALVGHEFNIASPAQLAEVLYIKLQLPTAGIKKGKTGYSTGQKELDKLRGQSPIIELIEQFRELTKLQNTYVEALPKLVDEHSRLHTTFNQDVAATGRLSSTDPNLQNIPIRTELGRKIREAFMPSPGNVFVSADYSQFELRLAAVLAGDDAMIADFNNDIDIHTKTAADVHGIALDDVSKAQRRDAKVVNFGVLYGMGPHALAQNTGMTFGEAKQFIDDYFKLRHKIRDYIDATIKQAHDDGYVETYYGRRRPTPDVKSSNFIVRSGAERAAANMPIQGTEADLDEKGHD